MMYDAIT